MQYGLLYFLLLADISSVRESEVRAGCSHGKLLQKLTDGSGWFLVKIDWQNYLALKWHLLSYLFVQTLKVPPAADS